MIRHIILLRLIDGYVPDTSSVLEAVQSSRGLARLIPEASTWRLHRSISHRNEAADFVGCGDFDNMEALRSFLSHPQHRRTANLWNAIATTMVADIHLIGTGSSSPMTTAE